MPRELGAAVTDQELKNIIGGYITHATGTLGTSLSATRKEALDYFYGEPLGDEQDGRSKFVMTEVHDVVEGVMPDLMDIFQGGDKVVEVHPQGPEDIEAAEQATELLNHTWNIDNPGYDIAHDWIKDGLIQRNGFIRVDWDKREKTTVETFTNATIMDLQRWRMEPGVTIEKVNVREDPADPTLIDGRVYDVRLKRDTSDGRVQITNVPPEEMLIAPSVRTLDPQDCPFISHARLLFASDLIEMGLSAKEVSQIPAYDGIDNTQERLARYQREDILYPTELGTTEDPAMRRIWVYDSWLRVDRDGDGKAELKHVMTAGPNAWLIIDEEDAVEHPFVDLTPIRMPHTWLGRSYADITKDLQRISSTIVRQVLDNMYNINAGRIAVNELVNLDDLLNARPDGIVRIEGTNPPSSSLFPIQPIAIGNYALPLLEYLSQVREIRTGVTRYNQGLDADSLNKTATGINAILNQAQRRLKLVARSMAEHAFKMAFGKVLRLHIRHGDRKRVIRLRNEWVEMNPSAWNPAMDVRINVALGYGNKDVAAAQSMQLLGLQEKIIAMQGGIEGPLVDGGNVFEALSQFVNDIGRRQAERFFTDPRGKPPPPPKPNPEIQLEMAKFEIEKQKAGMDMQAKQADVEVARTKAQADIQMTQMRTQADIAAMRAKAAADIQIKRETSRANMQLKREEQAVMLPVKAAAMARQTGQPPNGKDSRQ